MGLRLITPPAGYPVSRAEVKLQGRIDSTVEDTLIDEQIAAATSWVEDYLGRSLLAQTWELVLDDFSDSILLPRGPITSVASVKYYDTNEALQTLDPSAYVLDNVSDPSWLVRASSATWPVVAVGVNKVIIRYFAGYAALPAAIKRAILVLIEAWFDSRDTAEIPPGVYSLIVNHRA